jgi:hypothetical protein
MPIPLPRPILSLLAAAAVAACAPPSEPSGCHSDPECPAGSRCRSGVCVADGRPVAVIRPLEAVEVFALVELDAAGSADPDDDDGVADHRWTVRSLGARCAPPEVAGREPLALVRFGCPGRYEVSLAVRDALGVESAPATIEVDVAPSTRPPIVLAGPDVATDHLCTGEPAVCRTVDPVVLTASTLVPGLPITWSVEPPPGRALDDGARSVRFAPAAGGTSALVESDGGAISGDWLFRAEARDAYGAVGAAYTRVSIRNRAPAVTAEPPQPFPHAFDPVRSRFTAAGGIVWSAHDPDGDPVELAATWRHVGDGGAQFAGVLRPDQVTFAVDVPYAAPEDALLLLGGAGLARTIELFARDPNGGEGRVDVAIEIANRAPAPAAGAVDLQVPHVFDPLRSRYVASARLGAWIDPDGDPLSTAASGVAPCDSISVVDGAVRVECSAPFEGVPAVEQLAGHRAVPVRVRDPWSDGPVTAVHTLEILNQPPQLAYATNAAPVRYRVASFDWEFGCDSFVFVDRAEFDVAPRASDPDGDPVGLSGATAPGGSVSPQVAVCTSPECLPFHFVQPSLSETCTSFAPYPSKLAASDGLAAVTQTIRVPVVRY